MGKAKRENLALGRENWASGQVPREGNLRFGQRTLLTSCAFLFFLSFVGGDLTPAFSASAHKGLSGCLDGRVQRSSSGLLIGWRFAGVQVKEMGGHTSGGAMRENSKRDNCNAVKMRASASEFSDDLNSGDRRSRGARAVGREARVEDARQRLEIRRRRWEAQRLGGTAMAGTATASIHMNREEVDEEVCAGGAKTSSDMKVRALLSKLEREQIVSERRNIINALQHAAPQDHPLAIDALCAILSNYKRESIGTRKVVLGALQQVATRGNELVVTTLLRCVKSDNCFEVRQPAMTLLASLANYRDTRAMDMALEHLRKKDLRGEPLFKPYGDPMALTREAIHLLANVAPKGHVEVEALLLRRLVDDSVLAVRIAAVEALARIADADQIADGGARGTVQAIALAMLDDQHLDSYRLHAASIAALKALLLSKGRPPGGVFFQ